ncbi:MAG TPA: MoaD/ThiS family protein [Candidatus Brocadiales bacterium]|nr:MoaD/ThiS family protein [Candidatus Brocadiales bacterium]
MPVTVRIPTPLRTLTKNADEVAVKGKTIKEVIENLELNYKGIKERICDENGQIRRFINFYLNDEDIRFLENQETLVKDGDQISIVPAIAGGRCRGNS